MGLVRSFQISAVFPHLTVLENVRIALQRKRGRSFDFWRSERVLDGAGRRRARELIAEVDLSEFEETVAVELPYGRKRALEIATTLALDPEMMLLDEPTAGMTHEDVERIAALIKRVSANRTVLMVEHNLSVVSHAVGHHHRAAARRDPRRGRLRDGVEEPAGDRGLPGMPAMLEVKGLNAWYGESHILHGVDLEVREGEVVTLLGRNGAGKTTTLKSIMGMVGRRAGVDPLQRYGTDRICRRTGSPAWASPSAPRSAASSPASTWRRT